MRSRCCAVCGPVYDPQPSFPFLVGNGQKLVQRPVQPPLGRVQDRRGRLRENFRFQALGSDRDPLDAEIAAARLQAVYPLADGLPIGGRGRLRPNQGGPLFGQARAVLVDQHPGQRQVAPTGGQRRFDLQNNRSDCHDRTFGGPMLVEA